ncbi:site-specific integrase [Mycobacterium angelicum]|nr:site-specific integrase [Mycobacterium angelicum]
MATGRWKAEGVGRPTGVGQRWRGWYVGSDGKQRTQRFRTEQEAERWVNRERGKVTTATWVNPDLGTEPFGVVAERWFTGKGHRKPKTTAGYRSLLDTLILPKWKNVPLREISYADYHSWLGGLSTDPERPLSASRIRQAHQLAGAVMKFAAKSGLIATNVVATLESDDLPRRTERERRYLTHAELLALAKATGRFETLTLVLGYGGLRFGEAVALRRKHVGDGELVIRASVSGVTKKGLVETTTKSGRTRHVPIPAPVWELLKDNLPNDPEALVFPGRKGDFLTVGEYRWAFDNACKEVGITNLVPHGLRHTTASLAISAGANVKVVQRLLGHASAAMTLDLYGHLLSDDLASVATALGDAIKAAQNVSK